MTSTSNPRPSDRFIPWYIVAFFVFQFVLFGWFTHLATSTYTGVVTDEAYEKGLAYNSVIASALRQDALGYRSSIALKAGRLVFTLKDKNGAGVSGARVTLTLFRPVQEGLDQRVTMTGGAEGVYTVNLNPPQKGLWEVRIHAVTPGGSYQTAERLVF